MSSTLDNRFEDESKNLYRPSLHKKSRNNRGHALTYMLGLGFLIALPFFIKGVVNQERYLRNKTQDNIANIYKDSANRNFLVGNCIFLSIPVLWGLTNYALSRYEKRRTTRNT